jgi:CheY-like chemotaxis protein
MSTYPPAEHALRLLDHPHAKMVGPEISDRAGRSAAASSPPILNVEDRQPSRAERTRVLRASGYRVIEAESAAEAIRVMTRKTVSLALVGVHLPDSDSVALCATLKRLGENVPVVLISATAPAPGTLEAARAAGAHDFLEEPINAEPLMRSINAAIANPADGWRSDIELLTDTSGFIVDATPGGARLLNGSVRGLQQRSLILYFEQHRETWRTALVRALAGEHIALTGRLRPKERRPVRVHVRIERVANDGCIRFRWTFQPDIDPQNTGRSSGCQT